MKLEIEYYQRDDGSSPVAEFIDSLPQQAQAKITRTLRLLEEFGAFLGMPYVRSLVGIKNGWELRVRVDKSIYRLGFTIYRGKAIIVHGFIKKSNKTESRDIKIIKQRLKEIR